MNTPISLEDYIAYWTQNPIGQVSLAERTFEAALQDFVATRMIERDDISNVVAELPVSAKTFNVIPGLELLFNWPLHRAAEIDKRKGMVEEVAQIANDGLSACGGESFAVPETARA